MISNGSNGTTMVDPGQRHKVSLWTRYTCKLRLFDQGLLFLVTTFVWFIIIRMVIMVETAQKVFNITTIEIWEVLNAQAFQSIGYVRRGYKHSMNLIALWLLMLLKCMMYEAVRVRAAQ